MEKLKTTTKLILQKVLGYDNYLFLFSLFSITIKRDNEFKYFLSLIRKQDIVLDIGANIGIMTIPLSKKAWIIHAFEPIQSNINALKRIVNWYKSDNIYIYPTALGNANGYINMITPIENGVKMQGLCHKDDTPQEEGERFNIVVSTLNNLCNHMNKIDAIKLDVENHEYEVLMGAKKLLIRNKPIVYCELWANEKRPLVIDFMTKLGYKTSIFNGKDLSPYTNQEATNFFFINS